jgi:hypothetical protein
VAHASTSTYRSHQGSSPVRLHGFASLNHVPHKPPQNKVRSTDRSKNTRKLRSSGLIGPLSGPESTITFFCHSLLSHLECLAGTTGLEPATSAVTEAETRNSLESGRSDGSFQRPAELLVILIAPLSHPRPLSTRPLPTRPLSTAPFSVRKETVLDEGRAKVLFLRTAEVLGWLRPRNRHP